MDEKTNCLVNIKKCEHQKLLALANIQQKEIEIMELENTIKEYKNIIAKNDKICKDMDVQIAKYKEQMLKLES